MAGFLLQLQALLFIWLKEKGRHDGHHKKCKRMNQNIELCMIHSNKICHCTSEKMHVVEKKSFLYENEFTLRLFKAEVHKTSIKEA